MTAAIFSQMQAPAGALDTNISAPVITLAVGQTTYPPEFDIALDDTAAVGDRLVMQRSDLDTTLLETYTHVITAGEAVANAVNLGLSGVLSGTYDYRVRIVQAGTNNWSNWSNTIEHGPDITLPVLTSPTASSTGYTTASIGVTTDTAEGTLYAVLTTSATPPSKAQVKAGQNNGGTAAAWSGSTAITTTGAKTFSPTGLTDNTTYYAYFMHEDVATNQSSVAAAAAFTTDELVLTTTSAWNPADKSAALTISGADSLTATGGGGGFGTFNSVRGTVSKNSGDRYCEFTIVASNLGSNTGVGFALAAASIDTQLGFANNAAVYYNVGFLACNGNAASAATWDTGDIIGMRYTHSTGVVTLYKNGVQQATFTASALQGQAIFPAFSTEFDRTVTLNTGHSAFTYQPSGTLAFDI